MDIGTLTGYIDLDTTKWDNALDAIGDSLSTTNDKIAAGFALGGAAAAGAFGYALGSAMDLEAGTDKVAAALGLTEEQARIAGEVAGNVYADGWGESSDQVNTAVEAIMSSIKGMKNASETDLQAVTQSALIFSDAMGIDVSKSAQVAGNMISNGLAKDGADAFDMLTAAAQKVPAALREDVLDAADEYGQFFNTLGIKGPEAMGMLAKGAEKGMYGIDKTGDAIKEFTIRSTDMSAASKAAYGAIGLDANKMANDILAGGETASGAFNKVIDGLLGIKDPAERANTAIALFGTPLEDIGVKDIPKFLSGLKSGQKGLGDYEGAAKRAGKTMSDNAQANLTSFTRTLKGEFVSVVGGSVLPVVNDLTAKLSGGLGPAFDLAGKAVSSVTGFFKEHQGVALTLAGVITALTAVTAAHSAVLAVQAAGGIAKWLAATKPAVLATKVWTATQWALNASLWANPITWIVAGVIALVAAIVWVATKTEWGQKVMDVAWSGIKAGAQAVAGFFTKTLPDAAQTAWTWITDKFNALVSFHASLPGRIASAVSGLFNKAKDLAGEAKDFVISKALAFVNWYFGMPGRIARAAIGLFDKPKALARGAKDYAVDRMVALLDWLSGLPSRVSNRVSGMFGKVKSLATDAKDSAIGKMKDMLDWFGDLPGRVSNKVGGMFDAIPAAMRAAARGVKDAWNANIGGRGLTIDLPDKLPGLPDSWSVSIPRLFTGARVGAYKPMTAIIGDANEPENVLRDSQLSAIIQAAIAKAGGGSGGGSMIGQANFYDQDPNVIVESLWHKLRTR